VNNPEINLMSHYVSDTAADVDFDVERSRGISRELIFSSEHESADVTDAVPTRSATVNPFKPQS
jgi:hypothetical protein